MASDPQESQGPDQCRGSLRCREFHDPSVGNLGGHYNCCCCEPCNNVRPFMAAWNSGDDEWDTCCRCAPRFVYMRFVPDDLEDACCIVAGVLMLHTVDGTREPGDRDGSHSTYTGSLFAINARVELGLVADAYGPDGGECGWKIELERINHAYLPDVNYSTIVAVDHNDVTCLQVPEIAISTVGPDECSGKLSLENVPIAKLPYIERQDVIDFENSRNLGYDPEFHDLDPPCGQPAVLVDGVRWLENLPEYLWDDSETARSVYWSVVLDRWVIGEESETPVAYGPDDYADGEPYGIYFDDPDCVSEDECLYTTEVTRDPYGQCVQVCSRLQERRTGRPFPWNCMEWIWFDDSYIDPYSGKPVLLRGWRLIDPRNEDVEEEDKETLWLEEDDERRCRVRPTFEHAGIGFGPALIEVAAGCSCALDVVVVAPDASSALFRCGFCQRWNYYCGTCRCIPATLCVMMFDGETLHPSVLLDWDDDTRRWGNEYDLLQISLENDEALGCVLTPIVSFDWNPPAQFPLHDCSDEFTFEGKQMQTGPYMINAGINGTRDFYPDAEAPVAIRIASLVPHCDSSPCDSLPCATRCSSNPKTVTATIEVYYFNYYYEDDNGEEGRRLMEPYSEGFCSWSVELQYWEQVESIDAEEGVLYSCGYEGWYQPGGQGGGPKPSDCGTYRVTFTDGIVAIDFLGQQTYLSEETRAEECDPFYVSTNEDEPFDYNEDGGIPDDYNWPYFPPGINIYDCLGCPIGIEVVYRVVITQ